MSDKPSGGWKCKAGLHAWRYFGMRIRMSSNGQREDTERECTRCAKVQYLGVTMAQDGSYYDQHWVNGRLPGGSHE